MKGWSGKVHRMLILWLGQIGQNRKAHHKESVKSAQLNNRLLITIIIISSLAGFASFINLSSFPENVQWGLNIIGGVLSLIVIILTGIVNEMKLGEVAQKNRQIASEYTDISALIQATVTTHDKPYVTDFLQRILDRISIIQRYGPDLIGNHHSIADLPNLILIGKASHDNEQELLMPSTEIPLESIEIHHENIELQEIKIESDSN